MKLNIYNTVCKVSDFSQQDITALYKYLSFKDPRARFMKPVIEGRWDGVYRFLNKHRMSFPVGLLTKVTQFLSKQNITYELVDHRTAPKALSWFPTANIELFPYQKRILNLVRDEIRGVIWLPVNAGKTYIAMKLVEHKAVRTLWIVPKQPIFAQTKKLLEESFNTTVGLIGMGHKDIKSPITLAMIQTLSKNQCADYNRMVSENFDMVLFDEVHRCGRNTYSRFISDIDVYYKFGMSGTPKHRDMIDLISLEASFGDILVKMDNKQLQEYGVSATPDIRMIVMPPTKDLGKKPTYMDVYEELIVQNEERNNLICVLAQKNVEAGRRVLILVDRIAHGENVLAKLQELGVTKSQFIYGEDSPAERRAALDNFELGNIEVLVSSTILNEGVNIPAIDCVIVAGAGKSPVKTVQRVGRALRTRIGKDKAYVIDFYDEYNKYLSAHSNKRKATYEYEIGDVTMHELKL